MRLFNPLSKLFTELTRPAYLIRLMLPTKSQIVRNNFGVSATFSENCVVLQRGPTQPCHWQKVWFSLR